MKYVKLIAKPDTWFKAGTEVYEYNADYEECKRVSLEKWNQALSEGGICVRGIRVCEEGYEQQERCLDCKIGEERIDGEWCSCDEFEAEIICGEDLDKCQQCDELAWDGYICHVCGVKNI